MDEPSKLDIAKQRLTSAKNDQQRKKHISAIRNELVTQYDKYLKQNQSQINQLQNRLDGLKKQLKTRVDAKDEMVTLELTRIVNESKGLSWPAGQGNARDDMLGGMGVFSPMDGGLLGAGMDFEEGEGGYGADEESYEPEEPDDAIIALNKLRVVALACMNYESAHMVFPSNVTDDEGKPLLSWRVRILPFLGQHQHELYNKFHLDEPWNSEHNIELLAEMPDVFESPDFENKLKTLIQGFDGEGTIFEGGEKVNFGTIHDGSSNTLLCTESVEDKAVLWTKPQDLKRDKDTKVKDLFRFKYFDDVDGQRMQKVSAVVLCDGSTALIRKDVSEKDLESLITKDDGMVHQNDGFLKR